jgi:hypothetical protein
MQDTERDAKYWRGRAPKARFNAEQFTDSDARRAMLTVAESYDLMAQSPNATLTIAKNDSGVGVSLNSARRGRPKVNGRN